MFVATLCSWQRRFYFLLVCFLAMSGCTDRHFEDLEAVVHGDDRPNILLIVADDLGRSDIGIYGGEIPTPNLNALAASGVQFTDFYAAPTCSPTRAMLLTGVDSHLAGLGNMGELTAPNQEGQPGYEGYLNERVVSLPELLADAGYNTYMSGKWHLGFSADKGPHQRGFSRSYAVVPGWAHHLEHKGPQYQDDDPLYMEDGKVVEELPESFFSSAYFTDKMIEYIDEGEEDRKPFFAYLTYTAPHWPLQAPEVYLKKYRGYYAQGYDYWREQRFSRMQQLGLVPADMKPPSRNSLVTPWVDLSAQEQAAEAAVMEVYAAMVDSLDHNIGRMLQFLENEGYMDNTIVVFISDNGAEGNPLEHYKNSPDYDNSLANIGRQGSFVYQGPGWGQVSAAPWDWWKAYTAEGGIHVPAMMRLPGAVQVTRSIDTLATVKDITPTLLSYAGVEHPGSRYRDRDVLPMSGQSLQPLLEGDETAMEHATMGWELFGRRALRQGKWKIRWIEQARGSGEWELFNLAVDPLERSDVAAQNPKKLESMLAHWDQYMQENGIIIPDGPVAY